MTEQNKTRVSHASPAALEAMARIEEKMREDFRKELQTLPTPEPSPVPLPEVSVKPPERQVFNAKPSIPIHIEETIKRPSKIGDTPLSRVRGPSKGVFAKRNEDQARANEELAERHKHDQEVQRFLQPHSLYGTLQAQARLIDKLTKKVDSLTRAVKKLNYGQQTNTND